MKIGYFADGIWSHLAWDRITANQDLEIMFVVPRHDTQDPVLRHRAAERDIPFLAIEDVNSEKAIERLASHGADLFVSMSFNQIIGSSLRSVPSKGFINCHAGDLPRYRGRNVLNWVLINDESEFGVTVHYIDDGIDTGDIIRQSKAQITDEDDYGTILARASTMCADLLYASILDIKSGVALCQKQSEDGFYCKRRRDGDEVLDWKLSSRQIFNFVRALTYPGPCARTFVETTIFKIVKCSEPTVSANLSGVPGEIIEAKNRSLKVRTVDGFVLFDQIECEKNSDLIRAGARFNEQPL